MGEGEIIVNGAGLTNVRQADTPIVARTAALDPTLSKCDSYLELCCRLPEWRDVPPETYVEIKKPPQNCPKPDTDDYYGEDYYDNLTCEKDGITYSDLDEIPSEDKCNSCYCDYGEVVCSKDLCSG